MPAKNVNHHSRDSEIEDVVGWRERTRRKNRKDDDLEGIRN